MSDFVNGFWSYFIGIIAIGGIVWCVWLLYSQRRWLSTRPAGGVVEDTGHVWDGDLTELNNPVPRWWTWMYLLTCVFALGYLVLFPGVGSYQGTWATPRSARSSRSRPSWPSASSRCTNASAA